jgi:hypothetical protein
VPFFERVLYAVVALGFLENRVKIRRTRSANLAALRGRGLLRFRLGLRLVLNSAFALPMPKGFERRLRCPFSSPRGSASRRGSMKATGARNGIAWRGSLVEHVEFHDARASSTPASFLISKPKVDVPLIHSTRSPDPRQHYDSIPSCSEGFGQLNHLRPAAQ